MTGTSIAQAIPIAISPILTRLYSPEEFGVFALYVAIVSIVSVLATGRYQFAIMLPKNDRDAMHVVALVIGLSFIVSVVLFLVVMTFNVQITKLLNADDISIWLYWIPVSTLLVSILTSLNYWCIRRGSFRRISGNRVLQSGSTALVQLAGGSQNIGMYGLLGGQIAGQTICCAALSTLIYRENKALVKRIKKEKIIAFAKKYVNFPKYLIFGHGISNVAWEAPIFFLNAIFTASSAGFYMLTQRVLGVPVTFVSTAFADVFRREASLSYVSEGQCIGIYKRTLKNLLLLAVLPSILFFFTAPYIFSLVFGEKWRVAGEYAQILTPVFFCEFVIYPLSSMFMIAEKQKFDLLWQIANLLLIILAFVFGAYSSNVKVALLLYSSAYFIMSLTNGFISWKLAAGAWKNK